MVSVGKLMKHPVGLGAKLLFNTTVYVGYFASTLRQNGEIIRGQMRKIV